MRKRLDKRYEVDLETGEVLSLPGAAMSSVCPRAGGVLLGTVVPGTYYERRVRIDTNCKTWRCLGCRDRMMALFKARVAIGCYRLGRCAFMTLTYVAGSPRLMDAGCVREDWRALFRRFKREDPYLRGLEWLRVMELTKAGTPHHHLVMGTTTGRSRCWSRYGFEVKRYRRVFDRCDCLSHRIARHWQGVTGDSYIVLGTPVTGAVGAGSYMGKYLGKEFDGARAEVLGMARRWSNSRGWPGRGRRHLRQTDNGGWDRHSFRWGHWDDDLVGGPVDLLERTGDELMKVLDERKARRRLLGAPGIDWEVERA